MEDYAKAIYALEERDGEVSTTSLADADAASRPHRPRRMIRKLDGARSGYAHAVPRRALTARGRALALEMVRHHRLLETYLAESLDMPWDRVHARGRGARARPLRGARGADRRQARQSDARPARRPDPVRRPQLAEDDTRALASLEPGDRGTLARVSDADPEMLRYLAERGIAPGAQLEVVDKQPFGGPLFVRFGDETHASRRRARRLHAGARGGEPASQPARCRAARPTPRRPPQTPAATSARSRAAWRGVLALLGPAFVAAVAYIDPGNFATNIAGGAKYGYMLVWVIVAANLMAMLVQYLSAKTGIATGKNLPELCREHFKRPVTFGLWVQAEAIAIATDLAEFVGAAIALNLLFGVPPFIAGLMTAVVAFAILELQTRGYRKFELAIAGFLGDRVPRLHLRPAAGRRRRAATAPTGWSRTSTAPTASCSPSASSARP